MEAFVAVVGCGQWGKNLVRNFHQLGALKAVCDPSPSDQLIQDCPVPFLSFEDILSDKTFQACAFAVPAPLHAPLAARALAAGKHVMIEKPMCLSSADVSSLIALSHQHQRVLMGGHVLRYHPAFRVLSDKVCAGDLGRLLFVDAYRQTWGRVCLAEKNVFWSLAPHDLSLVLALAQEKPLTVHARADRFFSTQDQGMAHLTFPGGLCARIFSSWLYPKKEQRLVVVGEKGSLIFDDTAPQPLLWYPRTITGPLPLLGEGDSIPLAYPLEEPLKEECKHFLSALLEGEPVLTDGAESLAVIEVLEAMDLSLSTGEIVSMGAC